MTKKEKTEIVRNLLKALKAHHKAIGEELKDAEESLNNKDPQYNPFHLLLGSVTCVRDRLEAMQNTHRAMIAMAKETEKDN
jgi:hypothetical protein